MIGAFSLDPITGAYVPAVPCLWYVWQFWKWQKVKCQCGKTFISWDLSLMPKEYECHYVLNHI